MKRIVTVAAAGMLMFSACGGSDSGGSSSGNDAKDKLFEEMMSEINSGDDALPEGALDESCVRDAIDQIPDDQAAIIADNLDSSDLPDGVDESSIEAMTSALFDCIDISALLEE